MNQPRYAPRKKNEKVRLERLNIALSEDEMELIRRAAHGQDRKICNFVLHAALSLARDHAKQSRDMASTLISK
jgi:uncharacterized protein (DUF1778 family)